MNRIIQTIFVLISIQCFGQQTEQITPFAQINGDSMVMMEDSTIFKSKLVKLLFSDTSEKTKPVFDKMTICRQLTFGEANKEYFFILLQDTSNKIRVAKWLEKTGNHLFVINQVDNFEKDGFKLFYIICRGIDDCFPELGVIDGKMYWSCGRDLICKKNSTCRKSVVWATP
jgi:hypothetical protein